MQNLVYGWVDIYPDNFNQNIFIIYYVIFILSSLILLSIWSKNSKMGREKRQAKIILVTTIITFLIAVTTDTILPMLGIDIFDFGIAALVVSLGGAFYAVFRYKMMNITTSYISDYMFKAVNNPIFIIEDSVIRDMNDSALATTGYSLPEARVQSIDTMIAGTVSLLSLILEQKTVNNLEVRLKKKNGAMLDCIMSGSAIIDEFNDVLGAVIILHDISAHKKIERLLHDDNQQLEEKIKERTIELEKANRVLVKEIEQKKSFAAQIQYMGYHDELTGLPNRRYFNEIITYLINDAGSVKATFAVIFLDFDNFKMVNDSFGHQKGDILLRHYTSRMNEVLSEDIFLARIGGDEFLILLMDSENTMIEQAIKILSYKIMSVFNKPFVIDNHEIFLTTSMGAAIYPQDGEDAETLIMNADIALYEAKNSGKNDLRIFTADIKQQVVENNNLRNSLFRALENKELMLYYQPQINLNSNTITGVEALMRWKQYRQHFIPPSVFIPIAEETSLIVPIGYWAIETACRSLKRWHSMGFIDFIMAVNISEIQLNQHNFVSQVEDIINKTGVEPRYLEFELTERIASVKNDVARNNLNELRNIGIKLSIDDFGTVYSSFINLKILTVDQIKISMDFIQEINQSQRSTHIVNSIIELAHSLGLEVVAEGVENNEQADYLRSKKCDLAQGYLFHKPMPASDIEKILHRLDLQQHALCQVSETQ